jgi:hypothetical protein
MSRNAVRVALIAIAALLAVVPIGGKSLLDRGLALLPSACTVGLAGTAVSVSITGGGSGACDAWVRSDPSNPWYQYTAGTEPQGAVICQGGVDGLTYTVRDQGLANLYGSSICSGLSDQATAEILRRVAARVTAGSPDSIEEVGDGPGPGALADGSACAFRLVGHDLTVFVDGVACEDFPYQLPHPGIGWDSFDPLVDSADSPAGARVICSGDLFGLYAEVLDTGGAYYATDVCDLLSVEP